MISDLFPRASAGFKLGLGPMRGLMRELGDPQESFRSVIVAGTNGKGSTAHALADVLTREGARVGLYTSPHLLRFSERVRVDGAELDPDALVALYHRVRAADARRAERDREATFFELGTAIALLAFADAGVERAVLEVGMGGRLDATNVVTRELSVITRVGLDHQRYLGDTLEEIAFEKAGIIVDGVPVVVAPQAPAAAATIVRVAQERAAPMRVVPMAAPSPLRPATLAQAALTAAIATEALGASVDSIEAMRSDRRWHPRGRYEWLDGEVPVLVDAAHNADALTALGASVRDDPRLRERPIHGLFNVLDDRPLTELIGTLAPHVSSLVVPRLATPRGATPELVPTRLATPADSVALGLAEAQRRARADGGIVLVAGSFQLLADVLQRLTGEPRDPPVRG